MTDTRKTQKHVVYVNGEPIKPWKPLTKYVAVIEFLGCIDLHPDVTVEIRGAEEALQS